MIVATTTTIHTNRKILVYKNIKRKLGEFTVHLLIKGGYNDPSESNQVLEKAVNCCQLP